MRWLYGVTSEPLAELLVGATGRPLTSHAHGGLRLFFETCAQPPEATRHNVLAYGRVLLRLCADGRALPFQFGIAVPEEADLDRLLTTRAREWAQRLGEVQGCSELIAHLDADATPSSAATSLACQLARVARDVRVLPEQMGRVRVACLVSSLKLATFRESFDAWRDSNPANAAWLTGPWPPLSFTSEPSPR